MERKIEIALLTYEKARKFLGQPEFVSFEKFYENENANITSIDQ
jgi:hypothetical protein